MDWFREHVVLFYGIGIGLLILIGAVLVSDKFATTPIPSGHVTWDAIGGAQKFASQETFQHELINAAPLDNNFTIADIYRNLESNPERFYASLNPDNNPTGARTTHTTAGDGSLTYDTGSIDALLAALKPTSALSFSASDGVDLKNVYSYIPSSIVGSSTPGEKTLTAAQYALYEYGNEAGGSIESYMTLWGNAQASIFKGFLEDIHNPEKADQARAVAEGLIEVGESLERMEVLPPAVVSAHKNLYESYKTIGENLIVVTEANSDDSLLSSIEKYNASVDQFARNYLTIVTIFSLNDITYDSNEPGSVFVFTPFE